MGQFTVSRCTGTPLRQDITLLFETKLAIVQQTTDQKYRILSNCDTKHLISTNTLTLLKMYACHSQIQDGDNFLKWPPCHNLSHGIKKARYPINSVTHM